MVFSTPPDYLWQTTNPITGVTTTWTKMIETDLSFGRASASYAVFSGDGGINPFAASAAPLKIRTFKFTYIHPYQIGESYTQQRDLLMTECMHGREMNFYIKVSDGSLRKGRGVCNVSDMHETRDAVVLFQATIEFECVNPYLTDLFVPGTLRYDNGLTWDVGHQIQSLAASAPLTGGTYKLTQGGNTTAFINSSDTANTINARLAAATPSPIPYIATGGVTTIGPLSDTPPTPVTLSAINPGTITGVTLTASTVTGGTLSVTTTQVGSAATPNTWDFSATLFTLNANPFVRTIVLPGNVNDREPVVRIQGPIAAPYYVFNQAIPGTFFGFIGFTMNESLNAGESHLIEPGRQSVRKQVGNNFYSSWPYIIFGKGTVDWFMTTPGVNVLVVTQGGSPISTTAQIELTTYGHYL